MELRYLQKWRRVSLTAGVGYYAGSRLETRTFGPFPFPPETIDTRHTNVYVYADMNMSKRVTVTAGIGHDDFRDGAVERNQVNPKVGVIWEIDSATTLRGAAFRVVERTLISGQTIEPTHVAGFNQFFSDAGGTESWRYGVAFDRRLGRNVAAGGEVSLRRLHVPAFDAATGALIDFDRQDRQSARICTRPRRDGLRSRHSINWSVSRGIPRVTTKGCWQAPERTESSPRVGCLRGSVPSVGCVPRSWIRTDVFRMLCRSLKRGRIDSGRSTSPSGIGCRAGTAWRRSRCATRSTRRFGFRTAVRKSLRLSPRGSSWPG